LRAVLRLVKFTTTELCAETGFRRAQVAPILAELKRDGFLDSAFIATSSPRPAHKPTTQYSLTEDASRRQELAAEVRGFLEATIQARPLEASERYLQPAERELDQLDKELDSWELSGRFGKWPSQAELSECRTRVDGIADSLELAASEAGFSLNRIAELLRSASPEQDLPLLWVWKRWSDYSGRLERVALSAEMAEEKRRSEAASAPLWERVLHARSTTALAQSLQTAVPGFRVGSRLAHEIEHALREIGDDRSRAELYLSTLSLKQAEPDVSVDLVETAYAGTRHPAALMTLAGLYDVVGRPYSARHNWIQWADSMGIPAYKTQLVLAATPIVGLTEHLLIVQNVCRSELDCSLFTMNSDLFARIAMRPLDAMFYNLADPQQWIAPSESIRMRATPYYACGFLLDHATFPGTPRTRLAAGLWQCGYQPAMAWGIAEGAKPDNLYFLFRDDDGTPNEFEARVRTAIAPIPGITLVQTA
jgi:hypothetical protein